MGRRTKSFRRQAVSRWDHGLVCRSWFDAVGHLLPRGVAAAPPRTSSGDASQARHDDVGLLMEDVGASAL